MKDTKKSSRKRAKQWRGRIVDIRTKDRSQYPAAPSAGKEVMAVYGELLDKAIGKKKKFNACVLGATPELRDMVLKRGGNLTSIDLSMEMFEKVKPFMKYPDHPRDVIVRANWIDNPLASQYFDVVMGDGISNNIPFKDQGVLFKKIRGLLKNNGRAILRDAVRNSDRAIRTVEEIDEDFMAGRIHWFDVFLDLYFYSDISGRCYHKKTHRSSMSKLFAIIDECHKQGRLSKKTHKALVWFRSDIKHTFMPDTLLDKYIEKQFTLLPAPCAHDFKFTEDTLIFHFGKPKK